MANSSFANTTTLTTDFNVSPYYDDYDKEKNYYRILFKPGYAVQARELTQMQTIIQKQIDRFGKHIFKEGSIVLPGKFTFENDVPYVKVKDVDTSNADVDITQFVGQTVRGSTTEITGFVTNALDGTEANTAATKTIYIRYLTSNDNANTTIRTFRPGETLVCNAGTLIVSNVASNTGLASRFQIEEGVIFAKEHFIYFPTQSVIIDRYGTAPTCQVGFNVKEEIVDYTVDTSLLDPALEATNYAAPGADRLKITPELVRLDINEDAASPDYVQLVVVNNGDIILSYERSQYNIIDDYFATRTGDESGDYLVKGYGVRIKEHLNNNTNSGRFTVDEGGNANLLSIGVEDGLAYVKGYQAINLTTQYVSVQKALEAQNVNGQIVTARFGNYFLANEYSGTATHNAGDTVLIYDTARRSLTNGLWSDGSPVGSVIGTAKVKAVEYEDGRLGTPSGNVSVYLFDVSMNGTNSFASAKSFRILNSLGSNSYGDIVLNREGFAVLEETAGSLIYPIGTRFIKTIRSNDLTTIDTTVTFKKTTSSSTLITTGGIVTISPAAGESFPYSVGNLSDSEKEELMLSVDENVSITLPGTVSLTSGDTTIIGAGTFFNYLNVGDKLEFAAASGQTYYITSIISASQLTVDKALPSTTSSAYSKVYKKGDILDLKNYGADNGLERFVTYINSPETLTINLNETFPSTVSGTLTYRAYKSSAAELDKTLVSNVFVKIDCTTAGTTGPFSLGLPDVYRIKEIRIDGDDFTSETQGQVATSSFAFDNGQRDEMYGLATITPKSGAGLSATSRILVKLDCFKLDSTTGSYFSVDSYPVNDSAPAANTIFTAEIPRFRSTQTGAVYDLRDCLDFRPVRTATASYSTTVAGATTNPSSVSGFDSAAVEIPAPQSQVVFDYSFYLPRKDVVLIDRDGRLGYANGTPAVVPITPSVKQNFPNHMALATLYIAPYPSISPEYAAAIGRKDISCSSTKTAPVRFTMRDIGVLKNRIENLEYYASLNALERNALDMKVLDENGNDRFKNGIFVDTFRDHSLGATYDPEYQIVVDPEERSIRPLYDMESIPYRAVNISNFRGHISNTVITLPYTEESFLIQNAVSTIRNIESSIYKFIGNATLNPPEDFWVDTQYAPDNAVTTGSNNYPSGPLSTTWNSWQKKITGYKLYDRSTGQLLATFNNKEDAYKNAQALSRNKTINQNTIGYTGEKISTIIEEVTENTRIGSETYQETVTDSQSVGDRVIDTSLIPYIRPQNINIQVRGLKANTRFYTFFDGERMSRYLTPLTNTNVQFGSSSVVSNNWVLFDNGFYYAGSTANSAWISDSTGELYGQLRLPGETGAPRFRVGTKEVVITDNPTNDPAATSAAKAYFVAQGIQQTKQDTILTTRQVISYSKETSDSYETVSQFIQPLGTSCMAYSFLVKAPVGEEGLFMTSADVFIQSVHPKYGVWFEIREMNEAGGITRNQVPFSEVWYTSAQIQPYTSNDGKTPFRVTFPAPVFLYTNKQYAFVIHTEGLNPDTYFWVSRLGDTDIATNQKITARPLTGTLYTTNNNLNWDMVPDLDMKITFNRAKFDIGTKVGTIGNKPIDVFELNSVTAPLTAYGETFEVTRIIKSGSEANTISVGDALTGTNSAVTVLAGLSSSEFVVTSNSALSAGRLTITSSGNTVNISSVVRANGILSKYIVTDTNTFVRITPSAGSFKAGDILIGQLTGAQANVKSVANLNYSVVDFEPTYISFGKTSALFRMSTDGAFERIAENENKYYTTEQVLKSQTYEAGTPSNQVELSLGTTTNFLSPIVDLTKTHSVIVRNLINDNTANETSATGGELTNKYISKVTSLAEGQDAEDVIVILTAYRPPQTNVHVYMKISNGEDFEPIATKNWLELDYVDSTVFSSAGNMDDFKEYTFKFPQSMMDANTGIVTYTNSAGTTFSGYKQFAIKVGLSAENPAVVPRVADLRIIAIQL